MKKKKRAVLDSCDSHVLKVDLPFPTGAVNAVIKAMTDGWIWSFLEGRGRQVLDQALEEDQ